MLVLNGGDSFSGGTTINGGMLVLNGSNSFSGGTTLNAGTLVAANGGDGSALGSGNLTLNGGTLTAGTLGGSIGGLVQAGSGQHSIAPGADLPSAQYGTLNLTGGLTTNANTTLDFNLNLANPIGSAGLFSIYGGDLINLGGSTLNVLGGHLAFGTDPTTVGDYRLMQNLGGNSSNATGFSLPPAPSGTAYSLSTSVDAGFLDLVVACTLSGGTWGRAGGGSWASPANWPYQTVPSSGTVTLAGASSGPTTITLDGNQSAGALLFNTLGSSGFTLAPGTSGTLTLGTSAGAAIAVLSGTQSISAPVVLAGSLAVSLTGGSSLYLPGGVSEAATAIGSSLSLSGDGQLILSGTDAYTGGTIVDGGTLYVTNPAAIEGGTSLTVGAGGTFIFDPSVAGSFLAATASRAASQDRMVAPVPEPGTLALLSVAGMLAAAAAWRRNRGTRGNAKKNQNIGNARRTTQQ